ncbi:MAG: response regulator [Chitinophagaceae bacterium]|nr:response regulator [Chitinophagaceae bacterium]
MKKKVLCIESNLSMRLVIQNVLSESFRVKTVSNIFDAMDQLPSSGFDCIVLSVEKRNLLPAALLHHLNTSCFLKDIPVVMIADYENEKLRKICDDYDVSGFFKKPFDPLRLYESVRTICYPPDTSQIILKKRKFLNLN